MGDGHCRVAGMNKLVQDKLNFKNWKLGIECKFDGRLPIWYRDKSDKEREVIWMKYLTDQYIGD